MPKNKKTWQWDEEIQKVVANMMKKQEKIWQKSINRKDWIEYKNACKIVKCVVSKWLRKKRKII